MEKKFSFNFSSVDPTEHSAEIGNKLTTQAAFLPRFTLAELNKLLGTGKPISESEVKELKKLCVPANSKEEYSLRDTERNLVFRQLGKSGILDWFRDHPLPLNDTAQSLLKLYAEGTAPELEKQNLQQLVASKSIINWLKGSDVEVPETAKVMEMIQAQEFLAPFEALTANFKGRDKELAKLSDYADWIPKAGIMNKLTFLVREIINWHEKPLLMITGVGGSGKSTLIAQFILNQVRHKPDKKLPFIYFDFDKPGLSLSNPFELLSDGLQQLKVQFPQHAETFLEVIEKLQRVVYKTETVNQASYDNRSRKSEREVIYDSIVRNHESHIVAIDTPVLIVFDSFEEVQYRLSSAEIYSLFEFINELSQYIPRIRPVFIGRAEVHFESLPFDRLHLEGFDKASAIAFLQAKVNISTTLAEKVYTKTKGNPLNLQLIAELIKKENFNEATEQEFFDAKIDNTLQQQYLVKRNLEHIHDPDTARIAVPGLLVREIKPEIILQVLAAPCGFTDMKPEQAEHIYQNLRKETFLVTSSGSGISFRQDLRIALQDMINGNPEYHGREIHDLAIKYYSGKKDAPSRAEKLYHHLMRGDDPSQLESLYDHSIRPYIENSLPELDENAYVYLSRMMGIRAEDSKIKNASQTEWELYQVSEIENLFKMGDESYLKDKRKEIQQRSERSAKSPLIYYEAKLAMRLGELEKAAQLTEGGLREFSNDDIIPYFQLSILRAHILEYQEDYDKAYSSLNSGFFLEYVNKLFLNSDTKPEKYGLLFLQQLIEMRLSWVRLARRMGNLRAYEARGLLFIAIKPIEKQLYGSMTKFAAEYGLTELLPFPFKAYIDLNYKNARHGTGFRDLFSLIDESMTSTDSYDAQLKRLTRNIKNMRDLENYVLGRYNLNLRKICEPGSLKICMADVVRFSELMEGKEA